MISSAFASPATIACGAGALASLGAFDWGPVDRWEPMRLPDAFSPSSGEPARAPTYLFTSYGKATYRFKLHSEARERLHLAVEGAGGKILGESHGSSEITLDVAVTEAGTYRLHAHSVLVDRSRLGALELTTHCEGDCGAKSLSVADFFDQIQPWNRRAVLRGLKQRFNLGGMDATLLADIEKIVTAGRLPDLHRIPTLPRMPVLAMSASALLGDRVAERPKIAKLDVDLEKLLEVTSSVPAEPFSFVRELPELRYGHYPDPSVPARVVRDSTALATAMTALAEGNGSRVRVGGKVVTTPDGLLEALRATGHTIELRNERTYANFLSLTYVGTEVNWPVWIDTAYEVRHQRLVVPVGHVQFAWRVWGPLVRARVNFFHGMAGVGFFPNYDRRPYWTGTRSSRTERGPEAIRAANAAAELHRRIRIEGATLAIARGTPDGYGPGVGMCHDSIAALEAAMGWEPTPFPTGRRRSVDAESPVRDRFTALMAKLPRDAEAFSYLSPAYRRNVLARVLAMAPYDIDTGPFPDEQARQDLQAIRREFERD